MITNPSSNINMNITTIVFQVQYRYYHYNTGTANNGYHDGKINRPTLERANKIAELIRQSAIETNKGQEQSSNILEILNLEGEGHITKGDVNIYKISTHIVTEKII